MSQLLLPDVSPPTAVAARRGSETWRFGDEDVLFRKATSDAEDEADEDDEAAADEPDDTGDDDEGDGESDEDT